MHVQLHSYIPLSFTVFGDELACIANTIRLILAQLDSKPRRYIIAEHTENELLWVTRDLANTDLTLYHLTKNS